MTRYNEIKGSKFTKHRALLAASSLVFAAVSQAAQADDVLAVVRDVVRIAAQPKVDQGAVVGASGGVIAAANRPHSDNYGSANRCSTAIYVGTGRGRAPMCGSVPEGCLGPAVALDHVY